MDLEGDGIPDVVLGDRRFVYEYRFNGVDWNAATPPVLSPGLTFSFINSAGGNTNGYPVNLVQNWKDSPGDPPGGLPDLAIGTVTDPGATVPRVVIEY